jgi:hypothetical protein
VAGVDEAKVVDIGEEKSGRQEQREWWARHRNVDQKDEHQNGRLGSSSNGRSKAHKLKRRKWGRNCLPLTRPGAGVFIRDPEALKDKYSRRRVS